MAMGLEYPLLGRGPNAFAVEHARFRTAEDAAEVTSDITNDPHSVPLSFLASAGILGAAGFLVAVGMVIRRAAASSADNLLAVGFFGGVVAYLVQALISIDTVALRTSFWVVAAGAIAALVQKIEPGTSRREAKRRRAPAQPLERLPVLVGCVLLAVLGLWGATRTLLADRAYLKGQRAFADGRLDEAIADLDAAVARRPDYFYRQGYGRDLGQVAVALADQGEAATAVGFLDRTTELFDYVDGFPHVASIVDYARVLRAWSETGAARANEAGEEASALYTRAVSIDPKNAVTVNEAVEFARSRNDWAALADFLPSAAPYSRDANLWGTLALAHANLGNDEQARDAIREALQLDPAQPSALEAQVLLRAASSAE
jgi:tetratricopeptide (TPR) repeat protein